MSCRAVETSCRTYRHRTVLCARLSTHSTYCRKTLNVPGSKMQHIQKRSKSIPCNLSNLRLIHQRLIEQSSSVLLLNILPINTLLLPILILLFLLLRYSPRNVKSHLYQLILRRPRLPAPTPRTPKMSICTRLIAASW